jgi:hypothetical protein
MIRRLGEAVLLLIGVAMGAAFLLVVAVLLGSVLVWLLT